MKYTVSVKPNAKQTKIVRISEAELLIHLHAAPQDGKANEELIRVLSKFFHVPQLRICIARGATGRKKVVEIV
jgi:uncharacterized protein (TIGR00251 family)